MSVEIAILDSGVKRSHAAFSDVEVNGFTLDIDDKCNIFLDCNLDDSIGHGTAIFYLISKQLKSEAVNITNIRIVSPDTELTQQSFEQILLYIYENFHFDIINISMGIVCCGSSSKIQDICNKIHGSGTIIVSAFDNDGAVSFPAALNNVIGVDSQEIHDFKDGFVYVENSVVNIIGNKHSFRVAWTEPDYIFVNGNSFTCANVTVKIAQQIIKSGSFSLEKICGRKLTFEPKVNQLTPLKIEKAAIFPFNKEIHALARFEDMLSFEIVAYYSMKITGQVGKKISDILPDCTNNKKIKNAETIDWDEFDTLILGHADALETVSNSMFRKTLANKALEKGKNLYCFDSFGLFDNKSLAENVFFPRYTEKFFTKRFGKLFNTDRPVLSVIGTNSKQGKFSLQLQLRKGFLEREYNVGQIGTEPASPLFGFDAVFPCGYNGIIDLNIPQTITAVNELIWNVTQKEPDIIITGIQSGFLPYNNANALLNTSYHQIVFSAFQPDAIILCINPYDEISFINQIINAAEGISGGTVVGIVCFPLDISGDWRGKLGSKIHITSAKAHELKKRISGSFNRNIGVYMLDEKHEIDDLIDKIIEFFQ